MDLDLDASGLLDGLDGQARQERAELITWLLDRGFSVEQIRAAITPILLPANRVMGTTESRLPAGTLRRHRRECRTAATTSPRGGTRPVDDPALAVQPRADAESVLRAAQLWKLASTPEQMVLILRLLMDGLTQAAVAMRQTALQHLLHPGTTELDWRKPPRCWRSKPTR